MKAYPQFKWLPIEEQYVPMGGMDLRDYFAAKAMQTLVDMDLDDSFDAVAEISYTYADAMMKAREQK